MIHLSRLMLDPFSRRVQKELAAPYEMHRTLCHAFPDLSDEAWKAARVLFRADEDNNALSLLVQSHRAPDWNAFIARLEGRYLLGAPALKDWEPRFEKGQTLRFRLQGNPTFAPKIEGKRGGRRGLYREAERLDWLQRQSETHGFELPIVETILKRVGDKKVVFRGRESDELKLDLPVCHIVDLNDGKRFALPSQKNQFSAARFDGTLRVTEPEKFAETIKNGIGKAKGFGFGLLSVSPVSK